MSMELRVLSTDEIRPNNGDCVVVGPARFLNYASATRPYEASGVSILDTTQSTSPSTGALTTLGGASAVKDVWVGGTLTCAGDAHVTGDAIVGRSVRSTGPISCASASVGGTLACGGSLEVGGQTECGGDLHTNSTVTAALSVTAGGLSLPTHDITFATLATGAVRADVADVAGALTVAGATHVGGTATVTGDLTTNAVSSASSVTVADATQCTTAGTGSVVAGSTSVNGGLGIAGNLTIDGKASVATLSVPNGGVGIAGYTTVANVELAPPATLYRTVASRMWGTIGALGLIYSNWYGYELQNVGGYDVIGSVAIPASCRPGGPLKLKMFMRDITTTGTAQLTVTVQIVRPGGLIPTYPSASTIIAYPFVVGDQSLTFWEGVAPATVEEVRNAVIKWSVVRGDDQSGGNLKVSNVELTYVHQSWGIPTTD